MSAPVFLSETLPLLSLVAHDPKRIAVDNDNAQLKIRLFSYGIEDHDRFISVHHMHLIKPYRILLFKLRHTEWYIPWSDVIAYRWLFRSSLLQ